MGNRPKKAGIKSPPAYRETLLFTRQSVLSYDQLVSQSSGQVRPVLRCESPTSSGLFVTPKRRPSFRSLSSVGFHL